MNFSRKHITIISKYIRQCCFQLIITSDTVKNVLQGNFSKTPICFEDDVNQSSRDQDTSQPFGDNFKHYTSSEKMSGFLRNEDKTELTYSSSTMKILIQF